MKTVVVARFYMKRMRLFVLLFSEIFAGLLALIQLRKMEEFKGCNRFPDFLCVFQTDFVEKKITALL